MTAFKTMVSGCLLVGLLAGTVAASDTFGTGTNQFTIDFVTIPGDTGSLGSFAAGSGYTFTGVNRSDYRIGKFEITNDHWNKFKASYGAVAGIPTFAYDSDPYWTDANVPTNYVSWCEAAQFVNWLNTSTGHQAAYKFTGTQGTSSFTLATWTTAEADNGTNLYRHKDAFYYLPTEDEWVKAAYWNGTSLQTYSNASPDDMVSGSPDPAKWNYYPSAGSKPWATGSGAQELNGTYDMMGNVWEWMESPYSDPNYGTDSVRGLRGGSYYGIVNPLASSSRSNSHPGHEDFNLGLRVASETPEPASLVLLSLGGWALLKRKRGTHEELLRASTRYRQMVELQTQPVPGSPAGAVRSVLDAAAE